MQDGTCGGVEVVNLDTIDDDGHLFVVSHDRPRRAPRPRGGGATGLAGAPGPDPAAAARHSGGQPAVRQGRGEAVTVGRLTWRTLRVIHTPADVPETLSLEAAERVGRALAVN